MIKQALGIGALVALLAASCSKKEEKMNYGCPVVPAIVETTTDTNFQPNSDIRYPKDNFDPSVLGVKLISLPYFDFTNGQAQQPQKIIIDYYDIDGDRRLDAMVVRDEFGKITKVALVINSKSYNQSDSTIQHSTYKQISGLVSISNKVNSQ